MAENLECSRIGVQFGNDFEGDGKSFLKASVVVSKEEADSQISNLQSQTGNNLDYNYALVLGINSLPENIEKLHTFLKDLFSGEGIAAQMVGGKADFKSTVSNGKVNKKKIKKELERKALQKNCIFFFLFFLKD